jgi:predicted ATPase
MRPELPAGTVTFLFTDVEGSTRLLHALGAEGYAAALAEHRRVIREACAAEHGIEVDTQGDAFFFAFPTAPGAVAAASAMTAALAEGPIQVRIGLHTGTPLVTDEGYVGDDVHLAARVAAAGHGGQVVVTPATAAIAQVELTDLGEHRLKDIEAAIQLYQVGASAFPPLKTLSNTNLPRPASSFVGREREVVDVVDLIRGGARLVTLTGPGGTGKTRLAIEAGTGLIDEFGAGAFWVPLAAVRDPALVAPTIAQTLGAHDGLAAHIADREMLLVIDNLEQVVEAAPELARLVEACPNLVLLLTSRELLRVAGEVEYPVPPLAAPEAVSLFCERSRLEPTATIAELCSRLDSLPLAVELAAARSRAMSPAQILERLARRLDLLTGGRDTDPRQQTLRATIEWSHDLLAPDEQALFARLSVFAGGWTLDAAESVADADLDDLQSLVEKSLVRYANERYAMLETIREFAIERPEASDPARRRRHAEHMRDLAVRINAGLRGVDEQELLAVLDLEHDNVRAALAWAIEADPVLGMETAVAMGRFWWVRGVLIESRRWLDAFLAKREHIPPNVLGSGLAEAAEHAAQMDDWQEAIHHANEALEIGGTLEDSEILFRAHMAIGTAYGAAKQPRAAETAYLAARDVAQATGNAFRVAATTYNIAITLDEHGERDRAIELLREALRISEEIDSGEGIASTLMAIGSIQRQQGDLEASLATLRRSLTGMVALGFEWRVAVVLAEMAAVLAERGELARAARLLGASEAGSERADFGPDELVPEVERRLGEAMDPKTFQRLRAEGRGLALDEAIKLALGP